MTEERDQDAGLSAGPVEHGLEHGMSPVDVTITDPAQPGAVRWMTSVMGVGGVLLLLFNATALHNAAHDLSPTPWSEPVTAAADRYYAALDSVGLNRPLLTLRGLWDVAENATFGGKGARKPAPLPPKSE